MILEYRVEPRGNSAVPAPQRDVRLGQALFAARCAAVVADARETLGDLVPYRRPPTMRNVNAARDAGRHGWHA